jgi:NTP pyrophosphatase (non-canonical NTP hydrolase)
MGPKYETQRTISDWASETFGNPTPEIAIQRMLKECKELENKLSNGASYDDLADELADVFITGYKAFDVLGYQAHACIDHKMQINRGRRWKCNGDGTGQHIEEGK